MDTLTTPSLPPASPIIITPQNVSAAVRDLPFLVRRVCDIAAQLQHGTLTMTLPDGRAFRFGGLAPGPEARMVINSTGFAKRLLMGGDIGIAESYLMREWDSPDLAAFLQIFCVNAPVLQRFLPAMRLLAGVQRFRHWLNRNSKAGSRRNIHAHYDLGNRFYSAWLDHTMTYSAGLFEPGDNDLSSAQTRKYRALAEATGIRAGDHVLEIGCGWGGFAEFAAREIGCRVTGLTISQEQYDFASQRIARAGLGDRVTIVLRDYRDEKGQYDRIASIEMFEAVGEEYWQTYFEQLRDRLRPGGTAGLQIITIRDEDFPQYRKEIDFIRRYVFPGGMLPSPGALKGLAESFGLGLKAERAFGPDYAVTLAHWRDRFLTAWPDLTTLGFDERFRRLWEYYLSYCEAGFRAGSIDVKQLVYVRP
jgi:cyclopropane-fatty-acyl-phospholipid synthase